MLYENNFKKNFLFSRLIGHPDATAIYLDNDESVTYYMNSSNAYAIPTSGADLDLDPICCADNLGKCYITLRQDGEEISSELYTISEVSCRDISEISAQTSHREIRFFMNLSQSFQGANQVCLNVVSRAYKEDSTMSDTDALTYYPTKIILEKELSSTLAGVSDYYTFNLDVSDLLKNDGNILYSDHFCQLMTFTGTKAMVNGSTATLIYSHSTTANSLVSTLQFTSVVPATGTSGVTVGLNGNLSYFTLGNQNDGYTGNGYIVSASTKSTISYNENTDQILFNLIFPCGSSASTAYPFKSVWMGYHATTSSTIKTLQNPGLLYYILDNPITVGEGSTVNLTFTIS